MKGKTLAKKLAMALLCSAALPGVSQAAQDAEFQTFLAKGGCGGEEDPATKTSDTSKGHSGCAAASSHGCGAASSHGCAASLNHGCAANTNANPNAPAQSASSAHNAAMQDQHIKTTYTGTSTPRGPNDGYPSTPSETTRSEYPKNDNMR